MLQQQKRSRHISLTSTTTNMKKGYSLVEMILYISLLSIFTVIIINSLLSFTQPYRTLLALRIVDDTGINGMERMTRDIRAASIVDVTNSVLGSDPGVLSLVATANGVSTTTKFYVQNQTLKVNVNGVYVGPLGTANSAITKLVFQELSNGTSTAVKINMTVQATVGPAVKTKIYHTTVILRGS